MTRHSLHAQAPSWRRSWVAATLPLPSASRTYGQQPFNSAPPPPHLPSYSDALSRRHKATKGSTRLAWEESPATTSTPMTTIMNRFPSHNHALLVSSEENETDPLHPSHMRQTSTEAKSHAGHHSGPQSQRQQRRSTSAAQLLRSLEVRHSPLVSTLRKRLVRRHTGPHGNTTTPGAGGTENFSSYQTDEQRAAAADLRKEEEKAMAKDGYDPGLVVRLDSRRRQVRLNHVQRDLIWTARQAQYHDSLNRLVACLQSHRSPVEKCQTLFALHKEVIQRRLRLRADTYEDIFHTLYSVGVQAGGAAGQPGWSPISASAQSIPGDAAWERDLCGVSAHTNGAVPQELASSASAIASTVLSAHGIEHLWEMYRYAVDSGTDPTPRVLQYVMGLLEHASVTFAISRGETGEEEAAIKDYHTGSEGSGLGSDNGQRRRRQRVRSTRLLLVEAKAHSLMMDADRFHLCPSEYTLNSYIAVCEACDVMHLAVARVTDYQTRQERQASAGTYARLLTGLVRCGHYDDAMAVVTTLQNVPMTIYLLNSVLQVARHSHDPHSAFTFYRATFFVPPGALQVAGRVEQEREKSEGKQRNRSASPATSTRSRTPLRPTLVTFSILTEVLSRTTNVAELDFALAEMMHFRVRGNGLLLNKLLVLMEQAGKSLAERQALIRAMESKHVRVFDENKTRHRQPAIQ